MKTKENRKREGKKRAVTKSTIRKNPMEEGNVSDTMWSMLNLAQYTQQFSQKTKTASIICWAFILHVSIFERKD